jgi:Protein of unknown function (DUF3306)
MTDSLNGRLARWSQRKAAARRGDPPPAEGDDVVKRVATHDQQPSDPISKVTDAAASPESVAPDEDVPELPPIEALTFQSDYTAFMAKNVPEALRRAALRKLWQSDPVLANLDGLNDYDEDYHLVDTSITAAQTAYKVGKGYLEEVASQLDKTNEPEARGAHEFQSEPSELNQVSASGPSASEPAMAEGDAEPELDTAEDERKPSGTQEGSAA